MSHVRPCGLLLALCSTLVFAQPAVDEAKQLLGDGEFARALKIVDTALPAAKDATSAAKLLLVRGQCLLALGQSDKASAAFTAALKKDLGSELDASTASPQAIELLDKARAGFPALVSITVSNGEANIRVDDKLVGPAPLTLELAAGAHVIEASARDGRWARADAITRAGRRLEVSLLLEPMRSTVTTTPAAPPTPDAKPIVTRPLPGPTTAAPSAPIVTTPPPAPPTVTTPPAEPVVTAPHAGPTGVSEVAAARPRSRLGWIPVAGGALLAGAGGVSLWQANARYQLLTGPTTLTAAQERDAMQTGPTLQTLGWVGLGVGAAAMAAGVVLLALPPGDGPMVSAVVTPEGGAFMGVSGRLP